MENKTINIGDISFIPENLGVHAAEGEKPFKELAAKLWWTDLDPKTQKSRIDELWKEAKKYTTKENPAQ